MTIENQFIQKVYYKTFLTEETSTPASEVLGEAYINESKNEFSNISNIRFAQGEFYYQNKDFEAAIFKWEKVNNALALWATKNIADAYFELGFLPKAEEIYQSIQTEDTTLTMEVSLQLLSLYIEQDRLGLAFKTISEAVAFQPDYPNITAIARSFYEKQEDWNNAIELAVQEGIRTQSLHWFDTLINYINKGFTKNIKPEYFYESLKALYAVDQAQFKELVIALWNSYQHESLYLPWIQSINHLFLHIETDNNDDWNEISTRYQETYFALITGNHFMHELNGLVPNLLTNWFSLTKAKDSLVVSAAVLAWNEVSPTTLESLLVKSAGSLLSNTSAEADVNMETVSHLFETIAVWAEKNDVDLSHQFTLLVHELCDLNVTPLLIAGTSDHDKTSFVNSILGENILNETLTTPILFKDASQTEITEFTALDIRSIPNLDEFHQVTATSAQSELEKRCIEIKLPSRFLRKNKFTFLITPSIQGQLDKNNAYFEYLQAADSLVYVSISSPLHSEEIDTLIYLREQVSNLQIHFVLHTNNTTTNEKLISKLKVHFPDAQFFPYSPSQESSQQLGDVTESILSNLAKRDIEKERIEKLIWFTQKTIAYLINERVELENTLVKSVRWNKHISVKLTGFINNLTALEKDKIRSITESYLLTKEEITRDIHSQIPELLQSCSDLVQEDSDFKLVHEELNAAMNERVQKHVQQVLLPKFTGSIQEWIETAHNEFIQAQAYLDEMSETFNKLYKEERMKLPCDFKLLDDWNRDVVRMTNRITVTNINILLRFTPTQFFLKSAGKLFGNMQKNQSMLANKYKQYIETEDYTEIAHTISKQFFLQFEVFEGALERDIMMFFKDPLSILKQNVDAAQLEIQEDEQTLATLRSNPETYHDPLALFKLQLLQHKFVLSTTKKHEDIFVSNESPTV
ncbi:GTP-binding protein [Bacillus thuringiensis serovar tenebrionis]|uniref:tetratricopeptide repeat protein n=1 Tax=Bacillus thuringiensis TaxID=1428 RepID=UPI0028127354|nr:GTP-binding protein [Bacillus thuringiensis]WMR12227.1 GTP-binding protein [Bacillus thuringiensis serovar tenebrionis]